MADKKVVVTVDGPAGSGETEVAKMLAERFGFRHISCLAVYRAVDELSRESKLQPLSVIGLLTAEQLSCRGFPLDERLGSGALQTAAYLHVHNGGAYLRNFLIEQIGKTTEDGVVIDGRAGARLFPNAHDWACRIVSATASLPDPPMFSDATIFLHYDSVVERARRLGERLAANRITASDDEIRRHLTWADRIDRGIIGFGSGHARWVESISCDLLTNCQILEAAVALCERRIPALAQK